jgi:hypothetical protein
MRAFFTILTVGGALLCGAGSWAATPTATLEPVQGDLSINHGKGFEKVLVSKIEAKVGDSVMVSPGGIAKVTYADGCQANVTPGTVMTITKLSPCASGSLAADLTPIYKAQPAAAPPPFFCEPWWIGVPLCLAPFGILAAGLTTTGGCTETLHDGCH